MPRSLTSPQPVPNGEQTQDLFAYANGGQASDEARGHDTDTALADPAACDAHVLGFDHARSAGGPQGSLEDVDDRIGQSLLNLEPAGEAVDEARDLGQTRQTPAGEIGHMRVTVERQQVMDADRMEPDPTDDDEPAPGRFGSDVSSAAGSLA